MTANLTMTDLERAEKESRMKLIETIIDAADAVRAVASRAATEREVPGEHELLIRLALDVNVAVSTGMRLMDVYK